ncbi:hypothetical protein F5Y17DRAFT_458028 [Xylariaceae sp. FL0594]|nr:hypothetical protein F5Y17DRAFT_458028 [Xylariaceae sp. FL0594]
MLFHNVAAAVLTASGIFGEASAGILPAIEGSNVQTTAQTPLSTFLDHTDRNDILSKTSGTGSNPKTTAIFLRRRAVHERDDDDDDNDDRDDDDDDSDDEHHTRSGNTKGAIVGGVLGGVLLIFLLLLLLWKLRCRRTKRRNKKKRERTRGRKSDDGNHHDNDDSGNENEGISYADRYYYDAVANPNGYRHGESHGSGAQDNIQMARYINQSPPPRYGDVVAVDHGIPASAPASVPDAMWVASNGDGRMYTSNTNIGTRTVSGGGYHMAPVELPSTSR